MRWLHAKTIYSIGVEFKPTFRAIQKIIPPKVVYYQSLKFSTIRAAMQMGKKFQLWAGLSQKPVQSTFSFDIRQI
jgi:hypothetical protein